MVRSVNHPDIHNSRSVEWYRFLLCNIILSSVNLIYMDTQLMCIFELLLTYFTYRMMKVFIPLPFFHSLNIETKLDKRLDIYYFLTVLFFAFFYLFARLKDFGTNNKNKWTIVSAVYY